MRRHLLCGLCAWVCFSLLIGPAYPAPAARAAPPPIQWSDNFPDPDTAMVYIRAFCLMLGLTLFFGLYFLPTVVAALQRKQRFAAIFFCNAFVGWIPFVWLLLLLSAFCRDAPRCTGYYYHGQGPYYAPPRR